MMLVSREKILSIWPVCCSIACLTFNSHRSPSGSGQYFPPLAPMGAPGGSSQGAQDNRQWSPGSSSSGKSQDQGQDSGQGQEGHNSSSSGQGQGSSSSSSSSWSQGQEQGQSPGQGQGSSSGSSNSWGQGQGQGQSSGQGQGQGQGGYIMDAGSMRPLNPAEVQAASSLSSAQGVPATGGSPGGDLLILCRTIRCSSSRVV